MHLTFQIIQGNLDVNYTHIDVQAIISNYIVDDPAQIYENVTIQFGLIPKKRDQKRWITERANTEKV